MTKILVSSYYLETVKQALTGDTYAQTTCRSSTDGYLKRADKTNKNLADIRHLLQELQPSAEKDIMLIAIKSLIVKEKTNGN